MSSYDLIPEEAYEHLPQEANDQFAVLVRIAQSNLVRLLDDSNSHDFSTEVRSQFISTILGIAEALDIDGLPQIAPGDLTDYGSYTMFQVYLAGVVARVRLQGNLIAKPHSVELGRVTKAKILQDIEQLRRSIDQADIPEKKRAALRDKLDELEVELSKQRLSFARTMAIAASIMAIVGSGTVALANASDATDTVMRVIRFIGEDKDKEEEERLRLAPPPKALPDHTKPKSAAEPAPSGTTSNYDDLDDDIPF